MGPARLCGARRGLVRSARALAAAALLALSGALALPATAQADILVSNIGQTSDATATVGFGDLIGQVFTVASGGGNYTLTSIEVPVELLNTTALTAEDIELLSASLWSADEFGAPGSSLQALTNPSSISDGDTAAFTDPAGTTLEAGKLYAVMFVYDKSSAELAIKAVRSNDEDGESLSGWTIYNSSRFLSAGNTLWQQDSDSLQIRVNGSAAGGTPTCTLNTGDLWCGVVTVGAITTGGSVAAHGFSGADGGLDDKTFSVGTNNYTIDGLYVGTAGDLNLDLTGALDAADKGNLELVVGSTAFDLDDATHVSAVNAYLWTGTGLDWSSDTYVTLRMRRAVALSTDATLSGLTVYDGSSNLALSPTFTSAGTEPYTASAAYDIATVTVTATKNQADATVAWLDASDATLVDADAMAAGRQVALAAGANTFKVKVTAEDGTTTKTYTVTVNRASPSCTLNTGDLWCGVITVGHGTGFDGYVPTSSLGALSDRTFSVGTNNYTIAAIFVQTGGFDPGRLTFNLTSGLTSADQAALVLHLGSTEFEFSDASVVGGKSYSWQDAGLNWSSESFVTLRLRDTPVTNNAPVFSPTTATREVEENSAAGTNVGAVIPEATDSDSGDTLTYSMEGTDAASFDFDASTRQITTITGVDYNYEAAQNSYSVTVKAADGNGGTATVDVTIDVTDVNEKSAKPDKPTLAAVTGSSTSLAATWTKPDLDGGPEITGYDLQYREGTTGDWEDFAHTGTATTTTITGLTADTSYQVQVRAKNGETDSDWSDPSDAVKTNAAAFTCTDNDVHLTGGSETWEGDIYICHQDSSQPVCDDGLSGPNGSDLGAVANGWAFAGVVCRQLGHATGSATTQSSFSGHHLNNFLLDDVVCNGSEANLGACQHPGWGVENCTGSEFAGVRCTVAATGLMATGGDGEVALAWDAPGADPGITRHEYRYKATGGTYPAAWTPVPDSAAGETNEDSHTVTGLTVETEYTFELRIVGGANASGADEATARTTGVAAPTNFTATGGDAQVLLLWDAPATGSGVTKHQYRQKTTGSYGNWTDIPNSAEDGANEASHTVTTDIVNDTAYTFELRAVKDVTNSDAVEAGPVTPTAMTPTTCTLNPGDLWCGVVTVAAIVNGDGFAGTDGDLDDKTFSVETNNYTINSIYVQTGFNSGALTFVLMSGLTSADRAVLVLHLGSAEYEFSDATISSSGLSYAWDAGLDWSSESFVELRLRAATETDATLSALSVTHPGGAVPLRPAFAPGQLAYRASVANPVDEVTVAATANVADARVRYLDADGAEIADTDTGTPGREVALEVGQTVVQVEVRATDRDTMRTYRVTVTRRAVDAPGVEGELRLTETEPYADEDNDRYGGTAGRVEVSHAGAWGTVCSDGIRDSKKDKTFSTFDYGANGDVILDADGNPQQFDKVNEAAALICKAKDYDDGEYYMKYGKYRRGAAEADHQDADYWPPGSTYSGAATPIWLDDLRCVAGESALGTDPLPGAMSHCSYAGWGLHNCTHKEDAVVRCWNNDAAGPGLKSLKGRFVSPPERHDGTNRVKVRVAFSEPVEESPENVGAHGVEVEGGEVTSVSPVGGDARDGAGTRKGSRSAGGRNAGEQDREVVWEFEIEPDSDGDLTVTLEAGRPCGEPGAICTADGRALSEEISTTVEGPDAPPPLTASFVGLPEAHDGAGAFRFRVAFSENIGISYRSLREDAFAVSGGRVTRGRRVDDRRDLFEMTVEPDGDGEVTVTLPAGRECSVSGAICTKGENRRQLTNAPTATVAGPAVETGPAGLTARFARVPLEHDGTTAFKLRIAFSETIRMSGRRLRSDVVAVSGGRATKAGRVNRRKDLWKLKVRPDSLADVTVTLSSGAACDSPEAVCTKGEPRRRLTNTISATVRGPVAVSVADARAREGEDETIDFAVSLSRAASGQVTVAYRTADGTATAGEDYTRASGKLRFAPGETEKTISVPVLDDVVDEGEETFRLRLSAASGARIADGVATGTIVNSDPLQKMWLSRFGRTVAGQVVDAVTGRLSGPPGGSRVTLGGQGIDLSAPSAGNDVRRAPGGRPGAANDGGPLAGRGAWEAPRAGSWDDRQPGLGTERGMTGRELLLGSSFHLAAGGGEAGGPGYAAWGRMSVDGFDGEAPADGGTVRLDGEVTTGLLGADAQWERWLAGVALSVSEGKGTFDQARSGTVKSSLTSVNPYVRYEASDRLTAWGLVGYGTGDMTMTQAARGERAETVDRTDISMRLGAAGARGVLLEAGETGGVDLALRGDAFLVQMDWEKVSSETDTRADASRLRLLLEGGRSFALRSGAVLTPALELGLRHDGGDAETGTGVEVGGRIRYTDAGSGLTVEANARKLVAHEDSGYEEWGAGGSVRLDPGASGRGLSLRLAPVWGTPSSGVERLLSARVAAGQVRDEDFDAERRLEGELGYGFGAFGGRGVMTPWAGLGLAEAGDRTWRAGARWSLAPHLAISLDGARREPANDDAPEHGVQVRLTLRW